MCGGTSGAWRVWFVSEDWTSDGADLSVASPSSIGIPDRRRRTTSAHLTRFSSESSAHTERPTERASEQANSALIEIEIPVSLHSLRQSPPSLAASRAGSNAICHFHLKQLFFPVPTHHPEKDFRIFLHLFKSFIQILSFAGPMRPLAASPSTADPSRTSSRRPPPTAPPCSTRAAAAAPPGRASRTGPTPTAPRRWRPGTKDHSTTIQGSSYLCQRFCALCFQIRFSKQAQNL